MSPQEFSRVCDTVPVTGRFAGTQIQPHQYSPEDLAAVIARAGFADIRYRTYAGGIVALHTAVAA